VHSCLATIFYHDTAGPAVQKPYKPKKPRKSSVEREEEYKEKCRLWDDAQPHKTEIKSTGNSMTMLFYVENILPPHIARIKEPERKYKYCLYLQEDGKKDDNLAARVKTAS
jgi:hypothetical protein